MNDFSIFPQITFQSEAPKVFASLFAIEKKSDLLSFCNGLSVSEREFCELVVNCESLGYKHYPKWREFIPQRLTDRDFDVFRTDKKKDEKAMFLKFRSKVKAIFNERRYVAAHFFVSPTDKWHLLYFDFRDTDTTNTSHWFGGPHIHFVNYLWPEHKLDELWAKFDKRRQNVSGKVYIAFSQINTEAHK